MKRVHKLTPSLHANIWGGQRLREYGKISAEDRIGESWELSFVPGGEALTEDGITLTEAFPKSLLGNRCHRFDFFPVLTKFIDAKEKLSVQVHPDDEYALSHEGQYGKSEMWYVVDAEEGAGLYMGLNESCSAEDFASAVRGGSVEKLLCFKNVKAGDVFFIPAGTIHAIGGGVLIYEIQQNSTLTYRLYDYMRRDKDGNLRELHVDKAMAVVKTEPYAPLDFSSEPNVIGKCEYFTTKLYLLPNESFCKTVTDESFLLITCVKGNGELIYTENNNEEKQMISPGDSFFISAGEPYDVKASGDMTLITVEV